MKTVVKIAPPLAVLAALTAAVAAPALTAGTSARDITVREKVSWVRFVHQKASTSDERLLAGDRVLTSQRLYDGHGKRIGTLYTDCVNVGAAAPVFSATMLCTASYRFAKGQFATVGAIRLGGSPGASPTPIIGSGSFRGMQGDVASARPGKGYDVDVLHVDG